MTQDDIDLELVDKTIALIPDHAWTQVRQAIITGLVDNMPGSVIERITGTYDDFDQAEHILHLYYSATAEGNKELLIDCFKIMGPFNCIELLHSLNITEDGISETTAA